MKYIDADLLQEKIKELITESNNRQVNLEAIHQEGADVIESPIRAILKSLLSFIDSLQQEQPEGDFEKEVDKLWQEGVNGLFGFNDSAVDFARIRNIALHFYELGKSSK